MRRNNICVTGQANQQLRILITYNQQLTIYLYLDRLRRHPPDWQQTSPFLSVVLGLVDVSRHPEIPDLDHHVLGDHAVPGCQVPVDNFLNTEIGHPVADLYGHLENFSQCRHRQSELVVLRVRTARPQVVLQVSVLHQLHQDEGGLALTDHSDELDDVLRVVVLHHTGLVQELNPLAVAGLLIDRLDGARYFPLQVRNTVSQSVRSSELYSCSRLDLP